MPVRATVSSKRHRRRKACERKKRYATQEEAAQAMRRSRADYGDNKLHTYGCRHCGKFHVGHWPKGVKQSYLARQERGG